MASFGFATASVIVNNVSVTARPGVRSADPAVGGSGTCTTVRRTRSKASSMRARMVKRSGSHSKSPATYGAGP